MAITADSTLVVTASKDNSAFVWRLCDGQPLAHLTGHTDDLLGKAITPDDQFAITCAEDNTARVWLLPLGAPVSTLKGHTDNVLAVCACPDNQTVVTASKDNSASMWRLTDGQVTGNQTHCVVHTDSVLSACMDTTGD